MSDQPSGEKTEEPTPKKLRDAHNKGQVAKSTDTVSTALLIVLFATFQGTWHSMLEYGSNLFLVSTRFLQMPFRENLGDFLAIMLIALIKLSLPFIAVVFIVGILANYLQIGSVFSIDPILPKFDKIDPTKGFSRIFSGKSFFEFGRNTLKVIVLGWVAFKVFEHTLSAILSSSRGDLNNVLQVAETVFHRFCWIVATIYILFSVADFFFQRYTHIKGLRMTKDEVKREFKETEGSPEVKGHRKQIAQEIAMNETVQNTKKATVLVTNPTHYAVALHYKSEEKQLPRVLAKGRGHLALEMMKIARKEGIPIMRDIQLAHTLYNEVELQHFIPKDLIHAIAGVLKWAKSKIQTAFEESAIHAIKG